MFWVVDVEEKRERESWRRSNHVMIYILVFARRCELG
jgi:hypothetical protein